LGSQIKLPHIAQVAHIKPGAKLLAQALGQVRQHLFSIGRSLLPALLVFHNHAADVPIGLHHGGIHRLPHLLTGSQQQGADGLVQVGWQGFRQHGSGHKTRYISYLI
jgi:hypothetical protein